MKVRPAATEDAQAIAGLMLQLGYEAGGPLIAEKLEGLEGSDRDAVFVAQSGAQLVGVISCHVIPLFHQAGNLGRITSLVIDGDSRGQGAGKDLVNAAESFFLDKVCVRFEVTSGDHRPDAHRFYESCGYRADERRFIKHCRPGHDL